MHLSLQLIVMLEWGPRFPRKQRQWSKKLSLKTMILAKITHHFQQKVVACICEKSLVQQRERFAFTNLLVILKYVSNNYMPACIMLAVSLNSLI